MDGVLIDFDKGYLELTGHKLDGEHRTDTNFWDPINAAGYDFWINLEWMGDGKELWDYIKDKQPTLLSAPSRNPASRLGKRLWVKNNIPGTKLVLASAEKKQNYSGKDKILIDDRPDNIEQWRARGGKGILHVNAQDTINQLQNLGL